MDFSLNEVQQMLQDSVRRFVDKTYSFEKRGALLQSGSAESAENWRTVADNGWVGVAIPESEGGFGGSIVETALVAREFGRGLVLEPYLGCAVLGLQTLYACPSSKVREELLPQLIEGSRKLALAYAEAESYGMPLVPALTATKVAGGFRLDGNKRLVLGGAQADLFIISAAVPGREEGGDTTLFLVSADAPGLHRKTWPLHDGSSAAELQLKDVFVSDDRLLSGPAEGARALLDGLAHGTVAVCAELIGAMEKSIEITAGYLKVRKQFGMTLSSFQALQHRMADMASDLELSRSMLHALLAAMEDTDSSERRRMVSQAKSLIGRSAKTVCGQAIQLHGGIGMTEEYSVGHYFKRAVVADLCLGSSDRHEAYCADTLQF